MPVMEQQRYADLARIMLASMPELPPERPVHMFGCGHPMLFPMLIALGAISSILPPTRCLPGTTAC